MDNSNVLPGSAGGSAPTRPKLLDARGRPYEPAVSPRLKILLAFIFAGVALLGATGAYLAAVRLLDKTEARARSVRLIGVSVHNFCGEGDADAAERLPFQGV